MKDGVHSGDWGELWIENGEPVYFVPYIPLQVTKTDGSIQLEAPPIKNINDIIKEIEANEKKQQNSKSLCSKD